RLGKLTVPEQWDPPVKADLTKVINMERVRGLRGTALGPQIAAGLIRACRGACGVESDAPAPAPPPPPPSPRFPDVAGAIVAAREARALLPGDPVGAMGRIDRVIALLT